MQTMHLSANCDVGQLLHMMVRSSLVIQFVTITRALGGVLATLLVHQRIQHLSMTRQTVLRGLCLVLGLVVALTSL